MKAQIERSVFQFKGQETIVTEQEFKHRHSVFEGAPDEWAENQGATHTLFCGTGIGEGTRPARLLKTRLFVGVDEDERGNIVWEKWIIRQHSRR